MLWWIAAGQQPFHMKCYKQHLANTPAGYRIIGSIFDRQRIMLELQTRRTGNPLIALEQPIPVGPKVVEVRESIPQLL